MKKRLVWSTFILLALLIVSGGIWRLNGQTAAIPSSLALTVRPELTTINQPTSATFAVQFPVSAAVPLNINLIRIESSGASTVIAALKDDGSGGDSAPGDRIFTTQITISDSNPKTLRFQASAAFRGQLKRTLSNVVQFAILAPTTQLVTLPPDPGEAGKATVAGTDSDSDGVRDDVQRFIVFAFPQSEKTRSALNQYARSSQLKLINATEQQAAIRHTREEFQAYNCLRILINDDTAAAKVILTELTPQLLNTAERSHAEAKAARQFSGESFGQVPLAQQSAQCAFDLGSSGVPLKVAALR